MTDRTNVAVLRALEVRAHLGNRLHIEVDPVRVEGWVWSELPRVKRASNSPFVSRLHGRLRRRWLQAVAERHPFVVAPRDFPEVVPFRDHVISRRVSDLVNEHRDDPKSSLWYRELCEEIARDGYATSQGGGCKSDEDVERFLTDYVLPLIDSIEQHGYDPSVTGEIGWAAIGPSGEVLKTKRTTHRFFIARALSTPTYPLQVAIIHADWWRGVFPEARRPGLAPPGWEDRLTDALQGVAEAHRR